MQIRKGVESFLKEMSKLFELVVFTSAEREYAKCVVKWLDPMGIYIKRIYSREHCKMVNEYCIKDLRVVCSDLRRVVLLDNSVVSFSMQMSNGIHIKSFLGSDCDGELFTIRKLLSELAKEPDVRSFLEKQFDMQKLFDLYCGH